METVAVCDTEPIAIQGLRSLLENSGEMRIVRAGTSLLDGMDVARDLQPSILILDKAFGTPALVDCITSLRELEPKVAVVVWSAAMSQPEALRLLQSGAAGVVRKTAPLDTVLKCLRTVLCGSNWMEEDLLREMDKPPRTGHSPLTSREAQVMALVERGMKNKDIAESLGIRVGTVKIHLKHIFEKTGIRGRYGLALSGLKEKGLLSVAAFETVPMPS